MNRYTFHIPCQLVRVAVTSAATENEAWDKIRERDYYTLHEWEGNTDSGKTELKDVTAIEGEKND